MSVPSHSGWGVAGLLVREKAVPVETGVANEALTSEKNKGEKEYRKKKSV